jgi:hypothetical protein
MSEYFDNNNYDEDNSSSSSDSENEINVSEAISAGPVLLSPPAAAPMGGDLRMRSPSFHSPTLRPRSISMSSHGEDDNRSVTSSIVSGARSRSGSMQSYHDVAIRPRSNPRNRTPMKNANVVLGPVNRTSIASEEAASVSRSSSAGRNSRPSSASRNRNFTTQQPQQQQQQRVMLGTGLPVGTILSTSALSALHEHRLEHRDIVPQAKSNKQGPGHRKVRRWNNDKFIGISADISHHNPLRGAKIANIYAEAEMNKWQYTMPNVPRDNRTIFGTLLASNSTDMNTDGNCKVKLSAAEMQNIRERFVQGEVGVVQDSMSQLAIQRHKRREEQKYKSGRRMLKENVDTRLLDVIVRACQASKFSRSVVSAFERLIVGHMSNDQSSMSTYKMDADIDIWNEILVQKPFITRKTANTGGGFILRLLFNEHESKGAFHRLLLHAVTQFHGLDTTSNSTSKGRVLTVTGSCKGSQFKLLDYVVEEDYVIVDEPGQGLFSDEAPDTQIMLESIATLQV